MKNILNYFTKFEKTLFLSSLFVITLAFFLFDRTSYMTLFASYIGVTSLILNAKGHFAGQILMIIFSIIYGIISYSFSYYGEMMTYLLMTLPMAVLALISWVKNPSRNDKNEVKVNSIKPSEYILLIPLSLFVTFIFYLILKYLNTPNLFFSTISITTSFIAVYFTFRRCHFFTLAYAANDIVLIILWSIASFENISYISVVICFTAFLLNDTYGFFAWRKMMRKQQNTAADKY